jgi:hypothetical protein
VTSSKPSPRKPRWLAIALVAFVSVAALVLYGLGQALWTVEFSLTPADLQRWKSSRVTPGGFFQYDTTGPGTDDWSVRDYLDDNGFKLRPGERTGYLPTTDTFLLIGRPVTIIHCSRLLERPPSGIRFLGWKDWPADPAPKPKPGAAAVSSKE